MLSPYDVVDEDQFIALPRGRVGGFQLALAYQNLVFFWVVHKRWQLTFGKEEMKVITQESIVKTIEENLSGEQQCDENFEIIQEKIITDECLFRLSDVLEKIWEFIVTEKLKGTSPGRTLNCKFHVGTAKTLVLIVEKDEMERGHIGHPTSVLLEFLDLEQKINITDHYLDVPMDLAKGMLKEF
ncbi:hypothetical protein V6N11_064978 [Hibiscus sabdariffa]|uniref:Uncharacterized protein n=1 Tax=Hibiscus sabdariffa TaxID=183260 RepID=A0ABR2SIU8_9ROSI